jgi:hypothetical protein
MPHVSKATQEAFHANDLKLLEREGNLLDTAELIPNTATATSAALGLLAARLLERSLKDHAEALVRSAEASDRHAASLKWATWALVGATVLLVIVSAALVWIAYTKP